MVNQANQQVEIFLNDWKENCLSQIIIGVERINIDIPSHLEMLKSISDDVQRDLKQLHIFHTRHNLEMKNLLHALTELHQFSKQESSKLIQDQTSMLKHLADRKRKLVKDLQSKITGSNVPSSAEGSKRKRSKLS